MIEFFLNKRVVVWAAFSSYIVDSGSIPEKIKGVLTAYDDEFFMIDNSVMISKKYVIKIQLA